MTQLIKRPSAKHSAVNARLATSTALAIAVDWDNGNLQKKE